MGSLRLFRPRRGVESIDAARKPTTALDAFASDQSPAIDSGRLSVRDPRVAQIVIVVLIALVLLEAVPATLWVLARLQPAVADASTVTVPSPPAFAPSAVALAAPPCEAPAAQPNTPAPPVSAAGVTVPAAGVASTSTVDRTMLAGLLAVTAPVPMLVYERGRLVGTTEAETLMLGVGSHDLEFVNESVGYRVRRSVTVQAGRTSPVRLEPPTGRLHINAVPWAEVWIDNERKGETPIGNLATPIGTRQVVFRHPELGERRTSVLVTLTSPARISMDMRNR